MHLVADFAEPLAQRYDDVTAAEIVARRGINAQPLSMYYAERTTRSSFVLGYACADEAALDAAVRTMVDALSQYSALAPSTPRELALCTAPFLLYDTGGGAECLCSPIPTPL